MSERPGGRLQLPELSADAALKVAGWLASVALLNVLVGSPVTDLYIGFSLVLTVFWFAWRTAGIFEEPPDRGEIVLRDAQEGRYSGRVDEDGEVAFHGPDGRTWSGSAWNGRWTLEGPDGDPWWGRVGRKGRVRVHDEDGRELLGTLTPPE